MKTLLVTSTQPEEGKTTVAVMLALTAALAGKRVLLVDADLRKPRVHRLLGLPNEHGLGDLLDGAPDASTTLQTLPLAAKAPEGPAQTLSLLSSGSSGGRSTIASAALRLGSPRMKGLLEELAGQFDFIFIDSPPVLAVSDPLFIAPIVDGVLLVLAVGVVGEQDAKQARERIQQVGGQILGVVMNGFDERLHGAGVHPYHESYFEPHHGKAPARR